MTSLLLNYEQLYSQTSKLSKKLPTSDPLLSIALTVLQEKFFRLVGSQPGSLYLTEYYVNSPQSSFVTEELAKLSLLATTLGINTELFSEFGSTAGPQNMMIPQFPVGSTANVDYIYANHFASNYSYSVTLPYIVDYNGGVGNLYSNLQDHFRVGIRSGYMNDPGTNQIFLRTNVGAQPYLKYISFSLNYRSNHTTNHLSVTGSVVTSFGKDIIITICNDSRGISFLINGYDYFGPITSEMVSFDVTQPMGFYCTPSSPTTSSNNSILVTGYTNNIVPFIPTIKAIKGTAEFYESYYSLTNVYSMSGYSGDNTVMTPSTSYATFNMTLSNNLSYKIGFRNSLTGGNALYMIVDNSYTFQIDYNGETHTYDPVVTYNADDTLELIMNDLGIKFKVNGVDLIANDSSFNFILNNFFGFPSPLFFFIEIISNEGSGLYLPNFSYNYNYNPFSAPPPPLSEFIIGGGHLFLDGNLLTFTNSSTKNTDYLISRTAYTYSTYSITLNENCDYYSPILFGLRSAQFGESSPSLCFVKVWQRTIYAPSGGHENVTTINTFVNTVNAGYISNGQIQFENPPSGKVITITKGDDGISFELSGYGQFAYIEYASANNNQYSSPLYFYATPRDTIAGEQYISVTSSGLS